MPVLSPSPFLLPSLFAQGRGRGARGQAAVRPAGGHLDPLVLSLAANSMARRVWQGYGARSLEEARSWLMASLRRRMGLFVVREMARHRLRRIPFIGATRASVVARGRRGVGHLGGHVDTAGVQHDPEDFQAHQVLMRDRA